MSKIVFARGNDKNMKIPFLDLKTQYRSIKDEVLPAINDVLDNTAYVLGKSVFEFEKAFEKLITQNIVTE